MSPAVTRPNGKTYQPRKIVAHVVSDYYEDFEGVVVFGTHDITRAQALADAVVAYEVHHTVRAADPRLVWWRDTFRYGGRVFETDEEHGRAGVYFADTADRPVTP
jgi:ABC-type proline/glycine betaine transport system ATPase subunit